MKKVSIIMGAYNCEQTLLAAIQSIINQTYENWELIICDDCSTDSTFALASEIQSVYPSKIQLLKNAQNISLGPTLNHCLKYVTGDYIARMDADDISKEDRIEKLVSFLETNPEYHLVASSMMAFDDNGNKGIRYTNIGESTKLNTVLKVPFCHATIMARRAVFEILKGYSVLSTTKRVEDVDLWFRFFHKGFKGYNLKEPLYLVREDGSEYNRRKFKNHWNATLTCLKGSFLLKLPIKYYIFSLFPLLKYFVPIFIKRIFHKSLLIQNKI